MYQIQNKLSLVYDLNNEHEIVSISFDINQKTLLINCTCNKGNFCHHTDHVIDFIYNYYFHYEELGDQEMKVHNYSNKLWLPVTEEDNNGTPFIIDIEVLYSSSKFHYYCPHCCPGIDTLEKCRHLDYIIMKFAEHYYDMKEQNDEINNIDLSELSLNSNISSSMDIDN